ncbi:MAG: bifunctional diaminohydroxyphosphoribosylaminopyrimidine deaminase/5-amino-6-(5-phosphoribosylamino)uracil reductase RibD [Deltaproteobacteria bacterium]|nr:bifunctional diaminohydroxyphosphoribosylaminopyrimidine deaminase/5-amino-6-(5-phosphoribosylamino)uracil reductase RibD [Deltaproteobacteria bacterium]
MPNPSKKDDAYWMGLALNEAVKARGRTSPNPMVGAVLVKGGKLLAKGYHRRAGLPHAEIEAMRRAKDLKGATLYVTLEPCCHEGKRTPPCTPAILASGIRKVVIGALDPNPQVAGKGAKQLRRAGLQVEVGVLEADCRQVNLFYNHRMTTGRPWVLLKAAASLDGRIALANGRSRWITGKASREWVHRLRGEADAILVGVGTVLADDPRLTARHAKAARQPIRIVLDPRGRIPLNAKVLRGPRGSQCWVVVAPGRVSARRRRQIEARGAKVLVCPLGADGRFRLKALLKELGRRSVLSLLVEGGAATWSHFIRQKCAQELLLFQAPKILGADARPLFSALGLSRIPLEGLKRYAVEWLDEDLLVAYRFA